MFVFMVGGVFIKVLVVGIVMGFILDGINYIVFIDI